MRLWDAFELLGLVKTLEDLDKLSRRLSELETEADRQSFAEALAHTRIMMGGTIA